MKKALHNGRLILKLLTNSSTNLNLNSRCYLSTQLNKSNHGLKTERETRSAWEDTLPNIMHSRDIRTKEDWIAIRTELFRSGKQFTPVNIDSFILNFCISRQNYKLAYSYMEFLKEENLKPNLATIGKYFKLFYLTNCNKSVEKTEELKILSLYQELRQSYKLLDASTCENIIHALSITENWKECLKLLDEIKISCDPSTAAYSVVASAAFKNAENDLAWKLLNELIDKNRIPNSIAYLSYLQQCEDISSPEYFLNSIETLFEFFRVHDIKCDVEVAEKIDSIYRKLKLHSKATVVNNRGICQSCKEKLKKFELSEQEFGRLKDAIFKNVIVGKNVFYKTTPDELNRFENFMSNMKKYDVVIDGLNVAYSAGPRQSPQVFSLLIASVVKHFADQNKSILVLGRTHMKKWRNKNWSYINQHSDTFLTQDLSQDDPYLLYCALNCGLNTMIVSKDLMRGHLFKLKDPQLKVLFSQWLTQSQYQLQYVNNQGKVFFKYPRPYVRTAQKLQNRWHVPYNESDEVVDEKWLCLGG